MPKTLLVDTNRAAYPIYKVLCDLGHEVWVVGGSPSDTLAKYAANYVRLDYSNTEILENFIEQKKFDYLVPGCTDVSYAACSQISKGRYPGIEPPTTTEQINTKNKFREIAQTLGMPVPRVLSDEEALTAETIILKPVDSFSGRGNCTLQHPNHDIFRKEFRNCLKASKTGRVIVEEFVTGQLFSHSAFIANHEIIADFIVQENCTASPYAVDTSRVVFDFPLSILHSLRENIQDIAIELQLLDGLIHTQFILKKEQYWVIEMTRRCPGDIYSLLIQLSTCYPYAASYLAPFIGGNVAIPDPNRFQKRIIRHTASPCSQKQFFGFHFSHPVNIELFVPLVTSGDSLSPGPDGRAGIFFFNTNSKEEQERLYNKLINNELYSFR